MIENVVKMKMHVSPSVDKFVVYLANYEPFPDVLYKQTVFNMRTIPRKPERGAVGYWGMVQFRAKVAAECSRCGLLVSLNRAKLLPTCPCCRAKMIP